MHPATGSGGLATLAILAVAAWAGVAELIRHAHQHYLTVASYVLRLLDG
jgi:hypothetical protein